MHVWCFQTLKKKGGEKMKPVQSCLSLLLLAGVMGYNPIAIFFLARVRSRFYLQQVLGCAPCGNRNDCPVLGAETDLLATYNFTRHLQGYTCYSYFFPGGFIHNSGPHKASNFFYAALQYTF